MAAVAKEEGLVSVIERTIENNINAYPTAVEQLVDVRNVLLQNRRTMSLSDDDEDDREDNDGDGNNDDDDSGNEGENDNFDDNVIILDGFSCRLDEPFRLLVAKTFPIHRSLSYDCSDFF